MQLLACCQRSMLTATLATTKQQAASANQPHSVPKGRQTQRHNRCLGLQSRLLVGYWYCTNKLQAVLEKVAEFAHRSSCSTVFFSLKLHINSTQLKYLNDMHAS